MHVLKRAESTRRLEKRRLKMVDFGWIGTQGLSLRHQLSYPSKRPWTFDILVSPLLYPFRQ